MADFRKMWGIVDRGTAPGFEIVEVNAKPAPGGGFTVRFKRGRSLRIEHARRLYSTRELAEARKLELEKATP